MCIFILFTRIIVDVLVAAAGDNDHAVADAA
jgi:hypothetical protein